VTPEVIGDRRRASEENERYEAFRRRWRGFL